MIEITFIPKYSPVTLIAHFTTIAFLGALASVGAVGLLRGEAQQSVEMIFSAIGLGAASLFMLWATSRTFIRRIKFSGGGFIIERYLIPAESISYDDIVDFGNTVIKTRQGNISLYYHYMKNASELQNIFEELIENGTISPYRLEGKLIKQEWIAALILPPAIIIALILNAIASYLDILPRGSDLFQRFIFMTFLLPVYIAIYWFIKNRIE